MTTTTVYDSKLDRCICKPGYQSTGSYVMSGVQVDQCSDFDECLNNSTICGPGGNCSNIDGSYKCMCPSDMFDNGITCIENAIPISKFRIFFNSLTLLGTQSLGCESNPCENGSTCKVIGMGYQCKCLWLYQGVNCQNKLPLILFVLMILLSVGIILTVVFCAFFKKRGRLSIHFF